MRRLFSLAFVASGAAALIYEVAWTRLLGLQLGHGVAAASTVLAAFMGGLAVGSAAGGRYATKLSPAAALRAYALLEAGIGLLGLLVPLGLALVSPLLARAYADGDGGLAFGGLRLGLSLLLLAIPAAIMGATFPIAARWFIPQAGHAARDAATLYLANTIGAAVGALAAGFLLLPAIGLSGATWVAFALNLLAAAAALWVAADATGALPPSASTAPATSVRTSRQHRGRSAETPTPASGRWAVGLLVGLSGFSSLALQVIWTRVLALVLGPTTYAFSLIVAIFIAGLAVGAAIARQLVPRAHQPLAALASCLCVALGSALAATLAVDRGLTTVAALVATPNTTFESVLWRQGLLAVALLAPMAIAFGAAFPFAVAAVARHDETLSEDLGVIYAVNTTGAILGALMAGFFLIPWAGLHGSIRVVAMAGGLGALAIVAVSRTRGRPLVVPVALAALVLLAGANLPAWDRLLLSSGAYKYASVFEGPDPRIALTAGELLYYREGASGTVAVRQSAGTRSLSIDGKVDASNAGDMLTQRLLAHVPLLLQPEPKNVAILGLGSGVTLGSALTHPIERADVLEISPEVVEASQYFAAENHQALSDRRTRLIVGDGRTHLQLSETSYDVIVSEPSNPWMAGIASLFTREFFATAKSRLSPGGVLCQWAHTYDISTADLQSIVATFLSVFPDGTMWLVGDGDVLLVGSNAPLTPRLAALESVLTARGEAATDLASVGVRHAFQVLSLFVGDGATLSAWTAGAALQTDNRTALEFSGPRAIFGGGETDNASELRRIGNSRPPPPAVRDMVMAAGPERFRERGQMLLAADAYRPAFDDFRRALDGNANDREALDGLIRAAAPLRRSAEAREILARLASDPTHVAAKLAYSRLLAAEGAYEQAAAIPFSLAQADSSNVPALEQLASVLADVNDVERLRPVVARLRAVAPASEASHYQSAALLFMEGRLDLAASEARRVLALNPRHAKAHNLLGATLASSGQRDEARRAFLSSVAVDPRDPATYTNLATLELQSGNRTLAARYYAEALTVDPSNTAARDGLVQLRVP